MTTVCIQYEQVNKLKGHLVIAFWAARLNKPNKRLASIFVSTECNIPKRNSSQMKSMCVPPKKVFISEQRPKQMKVVCFFGTTVPPAAGGACTMYLLYRRLFQPKHLHELELEIFHWKAHCFVHMSWHIIHLLVLFLLNVSGISVFILLKTLVESWNQFKSQVILLSANSLILP